MANNFNYLIDNIKKILESELSDVNAIILEKMQNKVELIPRVASHIVSTGGKRIRPILTLLSAKLFGYEGKKDILLAACIEFIHTATLLHDDVVDENDSRRGIATSNNIWGNKASVLVGDYLFTKSFELMVDANSLEILRVLSNASSIIAQGEVMQLAFTNNIDITFKDYEDIIFAKTASLFSSATKVGAMLGNTSKENITNIAEYATNLGIVFQITDDILDYESTTKDLGKNIGTDFKEGKITLPILLILESCNYEEKMFIKNTFTDMIQDDSSFQSILELINKYSTIERSVAIANTYVNKGLKNLDDIKISNTFKDLFKDILVQSVIRKS